MMTIILGVEEDGCNLRLNTGESVLNYKFRTKEELRDLFRKIENEYKIDLDDVPIMCSSSMDFPEEYTTDKEILALAAFIRNL